jgi:osmoprotectant transport system permease protein
MNSSRRPSPTFPWWRLLTLCLAGLLTLPTLAAEPLRIGSKRFTEAYILAQVVAQTAAPHAAVEVKAGLGNTAIVYEALRSGSIDLYPEYTGTIALEILKDPGATSLEAMRPALAKLGLGVDVPFGFNDGYALAMREDRAAALGIRKLSDLVRHPELKLGLSNEFIGRADGWPGLVKRYGLGQRPQGLDHGLAYDAVGGGQVDVIDIYTTDAKIGHLGLRVLEDDAGHFPRYDAVLLYRLDVPQRFPQAWAALQRLAGRIDEAAMIRLNARAELERVPFERIAADQLAGTQGVASAGGFASQLFGPDFLRLTMQHLGLVIASVAAAVAVGVPLAVAVAPHAALRGAVLGVTGVLQTVPSLAMLAVLISLLGRIGTAPALVALTLCGAAAPVLRHRHRRHRRHLLPAGRHAGPADQQQGHRGRQEDQRHRRGRRRLGRPMPSCWATRRSNRPSSPPTSWTPPTTARASSNAPLKNLRALGALYPETVQLITRADIRHQQRARPEGQEHQLGRAGLGPVPAADRPAAGARHDAPT